MASPTVDDHGDGAGLSTDRVPALASGAAVDEARRRGTAFRRDRDRSAAGRCDQPSAGGSGRADAAAHRLAGALGPLAARARPGVRHLHGPALVPRACVGGDPAGGPGCGGQSPDGRVPRRSLRRSGSGGARDRTGRPACAQPHRRRPRALCAPPGPDPSPDACATAHPHRGDGPRPGRYHSPSAGGGDLGDVGLPAPPDHPGAPAATGNGAWPAAASSGWTSTTTATRFGSSSTAGSDADEGRFRDRHRDNRATADGRATLRYGHADVFGDSCGVAAEQGRVLEDRGWTGRPRACGPHCRSPMIINGWRHDDVASG